MMNRKYANSSCPDGEIEKRQGGYTIRFERYLPHPVEKVWGAITEPENLALWLANVDMDLRLGGAVEIRFTNSVYVVTGEITELIPGTVLEFTWNSRDIEASLLRWELSSENKDQCLLQLRHTIAGDINPSLCSGWHVHLGLLADMLEELPEVFSWPGEEWEEWERYYAQKNEGQ
jgi:uncharacterized protein YndB with AHSA1/START domain